MNEMRQGGIEMEQSHEVSVKVLGRMRDLGLGNPDGIPSEYADCSQEELTEIAERCARELVEPTDLTRTACVDGRRTLHNADGSEAEIRLRRVGGSASNFGVALNADAPIVNTVERTARLGDQIQTVDDFMGERSAHEGGCGGANGEVTDHELIAQNPAMLNAVKVLMSLPEVQEYTRASFDDTLGERVKENAAKTAAFLDAAGWDGQKYVDGVRSQNPRGVEVLEVDHDDHKFHGHKEPSLMIILGDKTAPAHHTGFVWNVKASVEAAKKLAGDRGREGYVQALIADVAKHMAVCKRLPSDKTPIFLVSA